MAEKHYQQIEELKLPSDNYILVVPGWYPTYQDPFTGDFNQRQIKAAGIFAAQVVLYIVKDQSKNVKTTEIHYKQLSQNIVEITVTYPRKKMKWFDTIHSNISFIRLLFAHAAIIRKHWGLPSLVHSYIVLRGGLGGLLLSKRWKVPFILSEHWTIYDFRDPHYLLRRNLVFKGLVKTIYKNVNQFLPVTDNLRQHVFKLFGVVPSTIVPNCVDTALFDFKENDAENTSFRFVHISTMSYQKNPLGLLRAFKKFSDLHPSTCLWMVGPVSEELTRYAKEIGLHKDVVHFTGSVSYEEVATILKNSKSLVLFSRYENLPCVILEALCCGVPVITTDVGGISEVIEPTNGILIQSENEEQLTAAFMTMHTTYGTFDRKKISEAAKALFSYKKVGELINSVYDKMKEN